MDILRRRLLKQMNTSEDSLQISIAYVLPATACRKSMAQGQLLKAHPILLSYSHARASE